MILTTIEVKAVFPNETLPVESANGLRYAVVYNGNKVVALFGSSHWAEVFIEAANMGTQFKLREVAE